ncbi:MAG: hypothetical protein EA355_04855 [Rhodobacteraceae bacterium]|nr:MAG: hypothetical protein EA355_04855 [Paracoccaceae bacterium]
MRLRQFIASGSTTSAALSALGCDPDSSGEAPSLIVAFFGAGHDALAVDAFLRARFPATPFLGGTSCRGVLTAGRAPSPEDVGLLMIADAGGDYGVGAAPVADDPGAAAEAALDRALAACGCEDELPAVVWIYQPPGAEERVLEALAKRLGARCPIVGGSSADDDVSGRWRQIASAGVDGPSVVVAVMFPTTAVAASFQSGYAPTAHAGVVTAADGRVIREIDGRPAARVYDGWLGGALGHKFGGGGVLAESALAPLGVAAGVVDGVDRHRLIHPARFGDGDVLECFAEVGAGETVVLMEGGGDALARRAGRTLADAAGRLPDPDRLAGALMIYCGGCVMAIGDRLDVLADEVAAAAHGRPVIGAFTFGEQGPMARGAVHGNLMVSALAFGG